jgi:hypothetical protein
MERELTSYARVGLFSALEGPIKFSGNLSPFGGSSALISTVAAEINLEIVP